MSNWNFLRFSSNVIIVLARARSRKTRVAPPPPSPPPTLLHGKLLVAIGDLSV